MVDVKTAVGLIRCPDPEQIGPRVKYWAEAMRDLVRVDELYGVMAAALDEAYSEGRIRGFAHFMGAFKGEVVDADFAIVAPGSTEPEGSGSEPVESAPADQADGSSEPPSAVTELPGSVPEGTGSLRGDQEEVEEGT